MSTKIPKSVYVFIAGQDKELDKYPAESDGYSLCTDARIPCRFREISDDSCTVILGTFEEKDKLCGGGHLGDDGWHIDPTETQMFVAAIVGSVDRVLGIKRNLEDSKMQHYALYVFSHMSGVGIESAQTSNSKDAVALIQKISDGYANTDFEWLLPSKEEVHLHAISSMAPWLLDLTVARIRLPEDENGMNSFLQRFENTDKKAIQNAFTEKWTPKQPSGASSNDGKKKDRKKKAQ